MSKADYPYPEDEFDAISPDAPTGVHRAPRSAWSRWWPFVVVLVVVPALAYGAVTFMSRTVDLPLAGGPSQEAQDPTDTGEDAGVDPDATDDAAPGGEASPTVDPTPAPPPPDLATPVTVLNGAGIAGLARAATEDLTAAGFTDVTPDDASDPLPEQSTVFIASEELRTTGELVGGTLGVPTVEVAPDRVDEGIAVVLVTDPGA